MIADDVVALVIRSPRVRAVFLDLIRALLLAIAAFIGVAWLAYDALLVRTMIEQLHMNDFGKFYYSARLFLDGGDMYGPSPATEMAVNGQTLRLLNMNPPHLHMLILPLATLAPLQALMVWALMNLASLAWAVALISRELKLRWTLPRIAWSTLAFVICPATAAIALTGQLTFLLLLSLTIAWIAARRGKWITAAIHLGLAASVKPFLGIFFIYLLLKRRVHAAVVMATTIGVCLTIGLAIFGWQTHLSWLNALSAVDWAWAPMNGSIGGLVTRGFARSPIFTPLMASSPSTSIVATVLALLIGVIALAVFARDTSADAVDRAFAGLLLTSQLTSPLGWIYYLWWPVGPALALWMSSRSRYSRVRDVFLVLAVPGLVMPLEVSVLARTSPWASVTLGSIYTWTTMFLWLAVILDAATAMRLARSSQRS
jgi:Glycosyltransferase family 87